MKSEGTSRVSRTNPRMAGDFRFLRGLMGRFSLSTQFVALLSVFDYPAQRTDPVPERIGFLPVFLPFRGQSLFRQIAHFAGRLHLHGPFRQMKSQGLQHQTQSATFPGHLFGREGFGLDLLDGGEHLPQGIGGIEIVQQSPEGGGKRTLFGRPAGRHTLSSPPPDPVWSPGQHRTGQSAPAPAGRPQARETPRRRVERHKVQRLPVMRRNQRVSEFGGGETRGLDLVEGEKVAGAFGHFAAIDQQMGQMEPVIRAMGQPLAASLWAISFS